MEAFAVIVIFSVTAEISMWRIALLVHGSVERFWNVWSHLGPNSVSGTGWC